VKPDCPLCFKYLLWAIIQFNLFLKLHLFVAHDQTVRPLLLCKHCCNVNSSGIIPLILLHAPWMNG